MNKQNIKLFLFFVIGLLTAFLVMYMIQNYKIEKKENSSSNSVIKSEKAENISNTNSTVLSKNDIDELTNEETVIDYVKTNQKLPDYYVTKGEARNQGWVASKGNLCDVLPGKAIGGDKFSNREKTLPAGNHYYEADVNYTCGRRNADRIVYTKNGEVWLTKNHYKSFEKK